MVNLRYHIVSLIAVFLALGVGIVVGSTVIDKGIVEVLDRRVSNVQAAVDRANAEKQRLSAQAQAGQDFADQAGDHLLRGRLRGLPVLLLVVEGVDRKPVEGLRQALSDAQANLQGTLWFTPKMRLDSAGDAAALAEVLGLAPDRPDVVRRQALARLAAALQGTATSPSPMAALAQAGFVSYDPPASQGTHTTLGLASVPQAGTRLVLISGAGAAVGDDVLSVPVARLLAAGRTPLVAAEAGQDSPGGRAVFVGLLRRDAEVAPRLSTVDDLESPMGEAAVVLALEDGSGLRTGHFGVGPGAQRLLPTPPPSQ